MVKAFPLITIFAVLVSCTDSIPPTSPAGDTPAYRLSKGFPSVSHVEDGRTLPVIVAPRQSASLGASSVGTAATHSSEQRVAGSLAASAAQGKSLVWYAEDGSATLWEMEGPWWSGRGATILQIPAPWKLATAADLNGDGQPDLIWEATTDGTRAVTFLNGGAYAGSYTMMFVIPPEWKIVAGIDMNADGSDDLVLSNMVTGDNGVLYLNGTAWTGVFDALPNFSPSSKLVAVGDMNGDGKPDLITQNATTGDAAVYFLNGASVTSNSPIPLSPGPSWKIAAVADFDANGKNDLVLQNVSTGVRSIWLMDGLTRTSETLFTSVSAVYSIVAAASIHWSMPVSVAAYGSTGANYSWTVGTPAGFPPAIRVTDMNGAPVAGVHVTFRVDAGGGSVTGADQTTNALGVATVGSWTMGTRSGVKTQKLTATAEAPGVVLFANQYKFVYNASPGRAVQLIKFSGDNRSGIANELLVRKPAVRVLDRYGNGAAWDTVTWAVTSGGGTLIGPNVRPMQIYGDWGLSLGTVGDWRLGAGANTITASVRGVPSVTFTVTGGSGSSSPFQIEPYFSISSSVLPTVTRSFMNAANRWREIITTGFADTTVSLPADLCGTGSPAMPNRVIHGLLIIVAPTSGSYLTGAPCLVRQGSGLPLVGVIGVPATVLSGWENGTFNAEGVGGFLHEMGHVLGIGTSPVWFSQSSGLGGSDPFFSGSHALAAWASLGGSAYPGTAIPEDPYHWRYPQFSSELTADGGGGYQPLSAVTVGAMWDFGWSVNADGADPFLISDARLPGPALELNNLSLAGSLTAAPGQPGTIGQMSPPVAKVSLRQLPLK